MKNTHTKIVLILGAFFFLSCGSTATVSETDYQNNFKVKTFFEEFNKKKFLSTIKSKKSNVEDYVKEIKKEGKENAKIKELYSDVQDSYNAVLSQMSSDINKINNILDFSTFNATRKYQIELKEAELKETTFINAAVKLLHPDDETSWLGDIFNTILSFIPGANDIQQIYLSKLKRDIDLRIDEAKWKNWSVI